MYSEGEEWGLSGVQDILDDAMYSEGEEWGLSGVQDVLDDVPPWQRQVGQLYLQKVRHISLSLAFGRIWIRQNDAYRTGCR